MLINGKEYALKEKELESLALAESYYTRYAVLSRQLTDTENLLPLGKIPEKSAELAECVKLFLKATLVEQPDKITDPAIIGEIWRSFFGFPRESNAGGEISSGS